MRILLLNIDSKLPNIALKKIEMWHKQQGDEVIWDMPIMLGSTDKAYASCIFTKNASVVANYKGLYPELIAGGTGYDLTIKLPTEIDNMKPKINYGFTTRGCIRRCPFCLVPKAEGYIHIVGDLLDFWDGKSKKIVVMDNNILALPKQFMKVCQQAIENKIKVDFNQGLDHRLITPKIANIMASVSHSEYHLAFDHPSYQPSVERAISLLGRVGIKRCIWYVLVGFDTTPKEDLFRLNYLRDMGQRVFVQRYTGCGKAPFYQALADWGGFHHLFATKTWEQFLEIRPDRKVLRGNEVESDIEL